MNVNCEAMKDRFRGCLIGGAAGDALGYEVEFLNEEQIEKYFGAKGIRRYALHGGLESCFGTGIRRHPTGISCSVK